MCSNSGTVGACAGVTQMDLSSYFNLEGITSVRTFCLFSSQSSVWQDGTVTSNTGIDNVGNFLSATALGTSPVTIAATGTVFNLGTANTNNVVQCAGQTLSLPESNFASIKLLALGSFVVLAVG